MNDFTSTSLKKLFPAAIERKYPAGQIVIYDGDHPDHVFFILSGTIKFYDIDSEGNEKILHIGGASSLFPLFYTFESKPKVDGFYTTLQRSNFLLIPIKDFRERVQTDAMFASSMLAWLAGQMDHTLLRLKSMERSSARHKLLHALAYLAENNSTILLRPGWRKVNFPLSQQTLAELAGLTRETVNATLRELEKERLIRIPKKMTLEINLRKLNTIV